MKHYATITVQRKDAVNPLSLVMKLDSYSSYDTLSSTLYHYQAIDFPMSVIVRMSAWLDHLLGFKVVRYSTSEWGPCSGTTYFTSDVVTMLEGMYQAALMNAIVGE